MGNQKNQWPPAKKRGCSASVRFADPVVSGPSGSGRSYSFRPSLHPSKKLLESQESDGETGNVNTSGKTVDIASNTIFLLSSEDLDYIDDKRQENINETLENSTDEGESDEYESDIEGK